MNTTTTASALLTLPVAVSAAAFVAAFGAFAGRREAVATVPSVDAHMTDLAPTNVWSSGIAKRGTTGTSYDPQSRGSTG
jgi:hypothetical protein